MATFVCELALGIVSLEPVAWDLSFGILVGDITFGICCLGSFAWARPFGNFRLATSASQLSLGNFSLETSARELQPGNFRFEAFA